MALVELLVDFAEVGVNCFSESLDQVDQEAKTIDVYLFELMPQGLLLCPHEPIADELHLLISQNSNICEIVHIVVVPVSRLDLKGDSS